jgi:hypothetical protein
MASRVRAGFCAVAETRVGILEYRPDLAPVGKSIEWYGEYLQPQLDLLTRLLWPGATVVEVGAGIGVHAVCLAGAIGAGGHLLVYEAEALLQRILRQNLGANRAGNVTVMRRWLGGPRAADAVASMAGGPATETLDELQLERLHLLKLNEGVAGLEVLAGAAETLWRLRPVLFIAAPDEATVMALAQRAKEFSYRCWRMETALFNPENFNRRDDDIFAGQTALALLATPEEIEVGIDLHGCVELS